MNKRNNNILNERKLSYNVLQEQLNVTRTVHI